MEPKCFTCALQLALCVALVCMLPYVTGAGAAKLGCRVKRPPTQAQELCASSVQALCKRCASIVQAVCKQGHFVCKLGFRHIPALCVYHGFSCLKLRPTTPYIILIKGSHLETYVFSRLCLSRATHTDQRGQGIPFLEFYHGIFS